MQFNWNVTENWNWEVVSIKVGHLVGAANHVNLRLEMIKIQKVNP